MIGDIIAKMVDKNRFREVLFTWMIIVIIGECISFLVNGIDGIRYLTWNGIRGGLTPDLFESIWHSAHPTPYQEGAIYPPLIYMLLKIFNLIISTPFPLVNKWNEILNLTHSWDGVKVFIVFSIIIFSGLWEGVIRFFKAKIHEKLILFIFFISSSPFIYLYERGNTVIFSMFFLLIFFQWYDSVNKYKKEIAIICLAMAICLKIYPILGGLILFTNRDKKLILKMALYTMFFFFVPFYFTGGFESFFDMINNIVGLSAETMIDTRDFGYGFKVNVENFVLAMDSLCNCDPLFNYRYLSGYLFIILLSIFYNIQEKEERILILILMMITLPAFSWIYNVIYIFIIMIIYLNKKIYTHFDCLIISLLYLSLIPLPYGYAFTNISGINPITFSTLVCNLSIYMLVIILFIRTLYLKVKVSEG